jgi:sulfite exporter TauE/SafE
LAIVLLVLLSFSLVILLLFLLSFSLSHCVACPSVLFFWSLHQKEKDKRTSNTMAKRKETE